MYEIVFVCNNIHCLAQTSVLSYCNVTKFILIKCSINVSPCFTPSMIESDHCTKLSHANLKHFQSGSGLDHV